MSMPNIPNITPIIDIDREDSINMLLASIALEEMGLAHIINAEGEKIQHLLNSEIHKLASPAEIKDINLGIERIIRETMKLQMLLQEKLESVASLIPKDSKPVPIPCPPYNKTKRKLECLLTGYAEGTITNKCDLFYDGTYSIESTVCELYESYTNCSLKYTLCKEVKDKIYSALFLAIPESLEIFCSNKLKPCPIVQDPNILIMKGQGIMSMKAEREKLVQCTVTFTLTVWDYGCNEKLQMVICSPNTEFNHDSGVVTVSSGCLEIRKNNRFNRSLKDISSDKK